MSFSTRRWADRTTTRPARPYWLALIVVALVIGLSFADGAPFLSPPGAKGADIGQPETEVTGHPLAIGGPYAIADVVDAVGPAVVFIEVEYERVETPRGGHPFGQFFPFFDEWWPFPEPGPEGGSGTGFIIDADGLILTNQHLFSRPELIRSIRVTLPGRENPYEATLRGSDFQLDLAVLQIEGDEPFPTVPLGDSDDVRVGEWMVAIGNPYRLEHTVTAGVLSATGRQISISDQDARQTRTYRNLMQTDAAINPGNSGGPLLNLRGEAIGINTAVATGAQGIGFAIPINEAKQVLNDLIESGMVMRPFIGIRYVTVDKSIQEQLELSVSEGIIIAEVLPGTAAERAGLRVYDVITAVGRKAVTNTDEFVEAIEGMEVGDVLLLTVMRDGREVLVRLDVGHQPAGLNL